MIRADLEMQCKTTKITPCLMVRDVSTRWNSTASMLERVLQLREALMLLVGMEQHNKPRGAHLNWFKLSQQEWDLLSQLFPLLDVSISSHCSSYPVNMLLYRCFLVRRREFRRIQHLSFMISSHFLILSHVNLMHM